MASSWINETSAKIKASKYKFGLARRIMVSQVNAPMATQKHSPESYCIGLKYPQFRTIGYRPLPPYGVGKGT
jgi:hypothetical protein